MPGAAHADHRRDHVDPTEDGAQTADRDAQDPQVGAGAGAVHRVGQRHIDRPAEVGRTTGGDEAAQRDERAEDEQPERQRVQPREGHVRGADLQRQHQVGEPEHDRRRIEQQHRRAVHREQLVVLLVGQELQTRQGQLSANEQRHEPRDREEDEAGNHVHDADQLVIGRREDLVDQIAFGTNPLGGRPLGLQKGSLGRLRNHDVSQHLVFQQHPAKHSRRSRPIPRRIPPPTRVSADTVLAPCTCLAALRNCSGQAACEPLVALGDPTRPTRRRGARRLKIGHEPGAAGRCGGRVSRCPRGKVHSELGFRVGSGIGGRLCEESESLPCGGSTCHLFGHILRVCTRKPGVGLDFVRQRGYGRRRWLKYPAQAIK